MLEHLRLEVVAKRVNDAGADHGSCWHLAIKEYNPVDLRCLALPASHSASVFVQPFGQYVEFFPDVDAATHESHGIGRVAEPLRSGSARARREGRPARPRPCRLRANR